MVDGRVIFVIGACLILIGITVLAAPAIVTEWLAAKGNLPATETVAPVLDQPAETVPGSLNVVPLRPEPVKEPPAAVLFVTDADSSETVAKKLQIAGIVSDAVDFNRFLVEEGYARRIQNGNHYLTAEMTAEELAKSLTGIR